MNYLQLVQAVCQELGIQAPSQVIGSQDPQTVQFGALLQRHGRDLTRHFEWEQLNKEYLLTTVAINTTGTVTLGSLTVTGIPSTASLQVGYGVFGNGVMPFATIASVDTATQVTMNQPAQGTFAAGAMQFSQVAYPLPVDWLKQIPQTEWDRTNRWPLMGPKSPQEWQSYKSGIVYAGPRERFRIQGGAILVNPPPPAPLLFSYEYISSYFVLAADGATYKPQFTVDTDTCVFDDSLMIAGLKMRWLSAKGLPVQNEMAEYDALLEACKAQNKSAPKLSLSPQYGSVLLGYGNIPDGDWQGNM